MASGLKEIWFQQSPKIFLWKTHRRCAVSTVPVYRLMTLVVGSSDA